PLSARRERPDPARRWITPARMGLHIRRRIRTDALSTIEIPKHFGLYEVPDSCTEWHSRILGHSVSEHSRLHALRSRSARADHRPGCRLTNDDDAVFVHRR